jgi:hypothetical protein
MSVKHSDILIKAKEYLRTAENVKKETLDTSPYVCDAIHRAASTFGTRAAVHKAFAISTAIGRAINGCFSVKQWLVDQGVEGVDTHAHREELMQEYRHRWLDHLIEQYKGAGK